MFEGIIGNDKIKKELELAVKLNKYSHSYIFFGQEGIGKKLIAKEFSKMILCEAQEKYCNKCKSCIEFNTNNNPDYHEIEPNGNSIKIEQIREMQRKITEKPIVSNRKVYVIDNIEKMTKEAQNCLLKTLEEPPNFVNIILIGENNGDILGTIKSRSTIIKFENIKNEDIKKYLQEKYNLQNISESIIDAATGSIGKMEKIKDNEELYKSVEEIINNIEKTSLIDVLNNADTIYKLQENRQEILEYLNVILIKKSMQNKKYLNCIDIIEETKKRLKANCNYNMTIDNMLFAMWEEIH